MRSAATRAPTVLTVLVLILSPTFKHNHWVQTIVGKKTVATTIVCVQGQRCPTRATRTERMTVTKATPIAINAAVKKGVVKAKHDYRTKAKRH